MFHMKHWGCNRPTGLFGKNRIQDTETITVNATTKGEKIMARKPMVTRTITTTNATYMCVNTETKEVSEVTITLPRDYKDEKAINRYVEKNGVSFGENIKPVTLTKTEVIEALYGMYEEDFVKVAKKMDSRFDNLDSDDTDTYTNTETEAETKTKDEEKPATKKSKK